MPLLVSGQDVGMAGLSHSRYFFLSSSLAWLTWVFLTAQPKKLQAFPHIPASSLIRCSGLVVLSSPLHLVSNPSSLCHQVAMIPRVTLKEEGHPVSPRKQRSPSCLHSDSAQKPIFMDILMEHSPTPVVNPIKKLCLKLSPISGMDL